MAGAGERSTKVRVERVTREQNSFGEEVDGVPSLVCEAWAWVRHGSMAERRQAAQERQEQSATFGFPTSVAGRSVKVTDRLIALGAVWNISGKVDARGEVVLTAVRAGDAP